VTAAEKREPAGGAAPRRLTNPRRFASGRAIGIGQTRVVRLRKVSARPSTLEKCSSRSKWQCLGTPRRGQRDRRLRGNIAGEVVGKAPCARLAKEWAQRKLSTPPPARSHATDNALQAPAASSATSKTFRPPAQLWMYSTSRS